MYLSSSFIVRRIIKKAQRYIFNTHKKEFNIATFKMSCNVKCILLLVLNIYPCVFLVILLIMKEGLKYVTYKFIENGMKRALPGLERMNHFQRCYSQM